MLLDHSLRELAELKKQKKVSAVELVQESLASIEQQNAEFGAFITVRDEESALEQARVADASTSENPLLGIPYSLKDAYVTTELPTSAGSQLLAGFQSPYDATVHAKLKQSGAILIGKNSQDAWGHGASNENTDLVVAKNPWNTQHIAGGSSGGSAVAVATGMTGFAIAEDTGGSIRNPASYCGTCGLKVTYGRVSRYGAIAYASSLDTMGPMARSVEDLALVLEAIAGVDAHDSTSSPEPVPAYSANLVADMKGKVIGLPKEFFADELQPEIRQAVEAAIATYEKLGAKIQEVSIPLLQYAIPLYYLLALSETSSNLARFDGIRYGLDRSHFTAENRRRILLGTFALSAGYSDRYYRNAQKARGVLRQQYQQAFEKCDVMLAPVTPHTAPKFGELMNDPIQLMLEDLYTVTVNPVGVPSLALPAGMSKNGLPIGMQIIGKHFQEQELFQFGYAYQQVTDWHTLRPGKARSV